MSKVEVKRSNTAKDKLSILEPIARKVLTEVGGQFAADVTRALVDKGKASSNTKPIVVSPAYQRGDTGNWVVNVGPSGEFSYLRFVHSGRRPGARMPPPDAIQAWMVRKGLSNPSRGSAFVIARAIGRDGIPPFPFLTSTFMASRQQLNMEIQRRIKVELDNLK
jgi:hypothetical protein